MTDYRRCHLCDLPLEQCAHGAAAQAVASVPLATGPTIVAREYSPCEECGEQIEPGEQITYTDIGWIHDHHDMVREEGPPAPPEDLMEGI